MIELVPLHLVKGRVYTTTIKAVAPSPSMLGAGRLVFRVRRWSLRCDEPFSLWECDYVCPWWWSRIIAPRCPDKGQHWRITPQLRQSLNYVRQTEIVSSDEHLDRDAFGPNVIVVGYDKIDRFAYDLGRYTRRVWYVTVAPGDGQTVVPDSTCVAALGDVIRWHKGAKLNQPWEIYRQAYVEEMTAKAEGRIIASLDHNMKRVWITVQEQKQQFAKADEESRIRRAAGL